MRTDKHRRHNKRKRSISDLMAGQNPQQESQEAFFIKSNTADFADRQKNIFAGLASLEAKHNEFQRNSPREEIEATLKPEPEVEQEKDDKFKIPNKIPARKRTNDIPGFMKQPGKWVKYSLADVGQNEMSEKSNTNAALAFLNERKLEREKSELDKSDCDDLNLNSGKASCVSGKWKMPEYVVGQGKKKVNRKRKVLDGPVNDSSTVGLSHLNEEDDDDVDESSNDGLELKVETETSRKFNRKAKVIRNQGDDVDD